MTIDKAGLIDQVGRTIALHSGPLGVHYLDHARNAAEWVLPVVAKELLGPLRKLHHNHICGDVTAEIWCTPYPGPCRKVGDCAHCGLPQPCPTTAVLDAIETAVQP